MAMKKKGYRSGGKVKRMSKGGAMGGKCVACLKGGAAGGKKPAKMMSGGGAMTMAQLRSAAKQRGMSLSPMNKAKGGAAKRKNNGVFTF